MWTDGHGRTARKLRISVTDRCNLRCVYCMPAEPEWLPKEDLLSFEELTRVAKAAAGSGVDRVRVTGGEPLLRRGLPTLIRALKAVPGLRDVAMTTNGILLPEFAPALREAGLDRITVSLDSLDGEKARRLTRRDSLDGTLKGISAARAAGFDGGRLKLNVVAMRGVNDDELANLAGWARDEGISIRFIEFMPLEGDRIWDRAKLVSAEEIVSRVSAAYPVEAGERRPGETAETFTYRDGRGSFGVIASVTRAFCGDCDRIRLTADGGFRTCLFAAEATDLRGPLRGGASDAELAALMGSAVGRKGPGHMISSPLFQRPDRAMNAIGG